ncbi:MAG TPA: DUF4157 domain-containing protein [Pyrinomonadaceae bacterium]|nr:DUF4157 domain-containing protein [Pyrinomonadaceae bacterium]
MKRPGGAAQASAPRAGILQRKCACGTHTIAGGECDSCASKRTGSVQRFGGGSLRDREAPPVVHEVLNSPGQSLDAATRALMETRFGHDFSRVRVHTDSRASESARAVGATAYAVGHDLVFSSGQYAPSSADGRRLLAHELAHTIQQGGDARGAQGKLEVSDAADASELEADRASEAVVRGERFSPTPGLFHGIARKGATVSTAAAADRVVRISIAGSKVTFYMQSGVEYGGSVTTDLIPGTYYLKPQPSVKQWIITGDIVPPGLRFEVMLDGADPWALRYSQRTVLEVGAGDAPAPEAEPPGGMSVQERVDRLGTLIQEYWTGGAEEEEIIKIISETPESDAAELIKRLTEQTINGKSYLEELDRAVDFGNNLTLHEALSQLRMRAMGAEKGAAALANAPVLPWHDVMGFFEDSATFTAERLPNGKVRIRYYGGTRLFNSTDFGSEIKNLPFNILIGGQEYDPDQVLIIHDYDSGRNVPVTANELAGYEHLGIRNFLTHVATVASFATPVGAARTAAGKAAVIAMERVLPAAILLVDENRLNLVKWFPKWGPRMIHYSDIAKVGVGLYGIARFAVSGWQIFQKWKEVRNARKLLEGAASAEAEAENAALALEKHADNVISEAEKIRASESSIAQAAPDSPAATTAASGADDAKAAAAAAAEPKPSAAAAAKPKPAAAAAAPKATEPSAPKATEPAAPTAATPAPATPAPAKAPEPRRDIFEGISPETKQMLDANPELKSALQQNPRAADALKLCRSDCFPKFATKQQIAKLEKLLAEAEQHGIPINRSKIKEYLHQQKNRKGLDEAIGILEERLADQKSRLASARAGQVQTDFEEAGSVVPDPTIEAPPLPTPQLRGAQGVATGGETLPVVRGQWFPDGRVGRFPRQIADKMRDMHFKDFGEFRETFWKLVAADKHLSNGWSPANITLMKQGYAPVAKGAEQVGGGSNAVYQLNHIHAIEHGGDVFDMDNIEIVTPLFHQGVGQ